MNEQERIRQWQDGLVQELTPELYSLTVALQRNPVEMVYLLRTLAGLGLPAVRLAGIKVLWDRLKTQTLTEELQRELKPEGKPY